jgi:hypothetical protein
MAFGSKASVEEYLAQRASNSRCADEATSGGNNFEQESSSEEEDSSPTACHISVFSTSGDVILEGVALDRTEPVETLINQVFASLGTKHGILLSPEGMPLDSMFSIDDCHLADGDIVTFVQTFNYNLLALELDQKTGWSLSYGGQVIKQWPKANFACMEFDEDRSHLIGYGGGAGHFMLGVDPLLALEVC